MPIDFRAAAWAAARAAACALALPAASAQTLPWQLGGGASVGQDDNIFRAPAGRETGDRYATLWAEGALDLRLGRQHLEGSAQLRATRYAERQDLDNDGWHVDAAWDGSTLGNVSWRLWWQDDRRLASYASGGSAARQVANVETARQLGARAQLGGVGRWMLNAELTRRTLDYSAEVYANEDFEQDSVAIAAVWQPLGPLSVTLRPRWTEGRFPHALGGALAFERHDVDLALLWQPRGASTLSARLSATRQHDVEGTQRDVDGATGQLGWQWRATGKTSFSVSASRDTGSETSFFTLGAGRDQFRGSGDNSRLTTAVSLGVEHALTGLITLNAGVDGVRRKLAVSSRLDGLGIPLGAESGRERSSALRVGLRWRPTLRSTLGCDAGRERRRADTVLSSDYTVNSWSCSAQVVLR